MADNTQLNTGTGGDVVATDDIGGIKYQRVKLVLGADGSNDGDTSSSNPLPAKEKRAGTSNVTSVAAATTSTSLLASNANRLGATFFNDSTFALYLKFGATASTSSFTKKLITDEFFAIPHPCWTGAIDGIWDGAVGSVRITELS